MWPPSGGPEKSYLRLPSSFLPESGMGVSVQTHKSTWPRPLPIEASWALGAGPSQVTFERPRASLPVTTRRIGFRPPAMAFSLRKVGLSSMMTHPMADGGRRMADGLSRRTFLLVGLLALAAPALAYESVLYEKKSEYTTIVITD